MIATTAEIITDMRYCIVMILAWTAFLAQARAPCSEKGCLTRETTQVFKAFIGNRLFRFRRLYARMEACFERHVADGIDIMNVSDTFWSKLVAYGVQKGSDGDAWPGFINFLEDKPTPLISKRNLGKFPSYPQESVNISIVEPCNTVSNYAFYQGMVELCEMTEWFSDDEWFTGLIRAFHIMGSGSLFLDASGTSVGEVADMETMRQLAWWYLQYGLQELPYDPIIHDLSEEPAQTTALAVIKDLHEAILTEPVTAWKQTMLDYNTATNTFAAVTVALLHRVFYRSQTVEKLTGVLIDMLVSGAEDLAFIKERYSPTVREAILQQGVYVSPLERLQLFLQFSGIMTKMLWAFYWQEDTFGGDHLQSRWSNMMGSAVTPLVNGLCNAMTGFNRGKSLSLQLSLNAYPGDIRCNRRQPHSKWHELAANGLVDIALVANNMNRHLGGGTLIPSMPTTAISVVKCFENGWKAQSTSFDDTMFSADSQDALLGGILEECAALNLFEYGNLLSCLTGKVVQLSKSTTKSTPLEECLLDHKCIALDGTYLDVKRFHDCLLGGNNPPCKSSVSSTTMANLEECLDKCSTDYLCAMTCLQADFSPWFGQVVSCAIVLSSSNPSSAAVSNCQKPLSEGMDTATAFLTLLQRSASISQSTCSKEHEIVLRSFASSQKCFRQCIKSDDDIPLDFVCMIQCMALS